MDMSLNWSSGHGQALERHTVNTSMAAAGILPSAALAHPCAS